MTRSAALRDGSVRGNRSMHDRGQGWGAPAGQGGWEQPGGREEREPLRNSKKASEIFLN
jgi:hypothetical protein